MLWRHDVAGEDQWLIWRYWCECSSPLHVLEVEVDSGGQLHLAVYDGYKKTFWQRLKLAISLIFKGEACPVDIYLCEDDRQELAAVIGKDKIIT